MKKYLKQSVFFFLYIGFLVLLIPQITYADDGIGYSYKIIKPKNQIESVGYFDLRMTPEQQQTVEIELYNITDKELSVDLSVNSTKTNSNGVIEYGPTKLKNDPSLKYDLKDIVKVPEKVTLQPKETKNVPVEITMPKEQYDGYIAGGIYLQKSENSAEKKADKSAKGVVNKYAFVVGMLLSETDTKVQPDLKLNNISAGMTNYRNAFLVNFSNIEATYVEGMTVEAQIFKKGSDEVLYDTKKENYRMAPNSSIVFPINLNGESFVPGDYTAHVLVTAGDKSWKWEEDIKVTKDDADKYNNEDVSLIQDRGINWKVILIISGGILLVLLMIYLVIRVLSRRKKTKQKNRKKIKTKKR
ncbi:hypothetical protein IGJ02_000491 [Enterococcus sp. DIV0724b]|uniref:DUF916 and DUF3324 domain-containing protein n=1 Tax=Enterococcus sp. DIV0724b TaxID=2774694 RepID=UPI003D2FA95E